MPSKPIHTLLFLCALCVLCGESSSAEQKAVPKLQILPQPDSQSAFMRADTEIARYYFSPTLRRPFLFPILGPAGRSLTRMGHPHDPETHSHHNSVWISHNSVNGVSFWDDRGKGRIVHQRVDAYEDLGETSWIATTNHWIDESKNNQILMVEKRRTTIELLPNNEFLLILDLQLETPKGATAPITLGKTPFGLVGVRMAKTIGVNDGGGEIRNSDGKSGEKDIFWQPAKWVDYSGPLRDNITEGITLMDHPANPNHPTIFHVRSDGWMGASLTQQADRLIEPEKPLRLRYALYVHAGKPPIEELAKRWETFAKTDLPDLNAPKKK